MHLFCVCFPARQHPEEMEAMGSGSGAEEPQNHTAMLVELQGPFRGRRCRSGPRRAEPQRWWTFCRPLGITVTPETVDHCVRTSLEEERAPLDDYLLSRSEACTVVTYLLTAAVRKFCHLCRHLCLKTCYCSYLCNYIYYISHLADTFIQSVLQLRTISDQNQQRAMICKCYDKSQLA